MVGTKIKKSPAPYNLTIFKGLKNVALNRTFARFVLTHPVSKSLLHWLDNTHVPDESFYTTLFRASVTTNPDNSFRVTQNVVRIVQFLRIQRSSFKH